MATSDLEGPAARADIWPSLPLEAWQDTYATLHMWTQIVGKIRLVQTPWFNHSWHVTFEVAPRGCEHRRSRMARAHFRLNSICRSPACHSNQRRAAAVDRAAALRGRGFLRRDHGDASRAAFACPHPYQTQRD